uniref:Palmdelphin n=1 Tax=Kryptolebias marmoratus TaxID=37003 RepID=A0A3Q2ZRF6_KRYMA
MLQNALMGQASAFSPQDKRRIQEDIAKKRRQIEEEKLKLQYIKKKSLREQWLMDGLSQQSEEEQEAMRLQAQDEQQQSDQLQSNILRIEKEIDALETQELNISANEEVVLKRLKEVERTPEDIIKVESVYMVQTVLQSGFLFLRLGPKKEVRSVLVPIFKNVGDVQSCSNCRGIKLMNYTMKIWDRVVEHDKKTGKSQVLSTETVSPESVPERGLKVYDDGRKSVYALQSGRNKTPNSAVGEMTPTEVEELLHKATDKKAHTEVQYHQPVYSVPYMGTRPSTPRTPPQTLLKQKPQDAENQNLSTNIQQGSSSSIHNCDAEDKLLCFNISGKSENEKNLFPSSNFGAKNLPAFSHRKTDPSPVPFIVRAEATPAPIQPVYRSLQRFSPSLASKNSEGNSRALTESLADFTRHLPVCTENAPSVNLVSTLPEKPKSESITMIFMGYEDAANEEEDIQAELVMIASSEDEDDADGCGIEECLSFHPEGCKSKIFQPTVGRARVTGDRDLFKDVYPPSWEALKLHKPTFIHKTGERSCYLQRRREMEPVNTCSTSMDKMGLCSTIR